MTTRKNPHRCTCGCAKSQHSKREWHVTGRGWCVGCDCQQYTPEVTA